MNSESTGKPHSGRYRRYLLGAATDDQANLIEEAILVNDEEFDQLQEAERLLIDDYVRDRLTTEEFRFFEANYAVNESRQARIIEARRQYDVSRRRSWFYAGGIAAMVTLAVIGGLTTIQRSQSAGWRGSDVRPQSRPSEIVFYVPNGKHAAVGARGNLDAGTRAGLRPDETLLVPCERDRPTPSIGLLRIVSVATDGLSSEVVVVRWNPVAGCWTGTGQISVRPSASASEPK